MRIYERYIAPCLIHLAMKNRRLRAYRERVTAGARGVVLEIGIGSALNIPFYGGGVARLIGLDPSASLLGRASKAARQARFPVVLVRGSAEAIPLEDDSVDTIVMAWTLCSIPDAQKALSELRRVLKPGGRLHFVEHGLAREARVRLWQYRLDPLWTRVSCHLDRPMDRLIEAAGFKLEKLDAAYLGHGPKAMTFMYEGRARPA